MQCTQEEDELLVRYKSVLEGNLNFKRMYAPKRDNDRMCMYLVPSICFQTFFCTGI